MRKNLGLLVPILASVILFILPGYAWATFSVSVRPYEGGYDLRYGKFDPSFGRISKEVTVEITSDITKQYRLVQSLIEPLSTREGSRIPQNSFTVYGVRASNKYGTLNIEQETPVGLGRQVIYTSNQNGTSDSFTLVYVLNASGNIEPGSYSARLSFTLEPIDSSQSPSIAILNVYAEIEIESSIEIRSITGGKNITLRAYTPDNAASAVIFNIKGGFGKQFRISQLVSEQPVSADGSLLGWERISFIGKEAQKGTVINEPTNLSARQQVIYTSSLGGGADSFVIEYNLGDLAKEKTGRYRTQIKYIYESMVSGQARLIDTLGLEIENPRIFDLTVTPETGGLIQFREVKPLQPPKIQEVVFQISTNIGKKYQVTQNMASLLTNQEGITIPKEYFTLRQESLETKGTLKYPEKTNLREGQIVLFISDQQGSADKFKVIYELSLPRDVHSGDYSTIFTYSVSEI